jgi:hypothetical protein
MAISLTPDYYEEIIETIKKIDVNFRIIREKLTEKDKRILELEEKLKKFNQNGS